MVELQTLRERAASLAAEIESTDEATDRLVGFVKNRKEMREYLTWYGANRFINDARHMARRQPPLMANSGTTIPASSLTAEMRASAKYTESILDSYFIGDKRLGDCFKGDIQAQIETHRAQIEGHTFEVGFLMSIAKKLTANKTVRTVWTDEQLVKLRKDK